MHLSMQFIIVVGMRAVTRALYITLTQKYCTMSYLKVMSYLNFDGV